MDVGRAIAVVAGGGRLLAGGARGDFGLFRVEPDGFTPVTGFGGDAKVIADFDGRDDIANAVAVNGDGTFVAAGSSSGDVAVLVVDGDGFPSTTFGVAGRVLTDLGGPDDAAYGVVPRPDGGVLVAGGSNSSAALLWYRPDGTLDPSRGTTGVGVTRSAAAGPWRALVAQPDGKVLVAGGGAGLDVARFLADGTPDPSFGSGGSVRLLAGTAAVAHALALAADGSVFVAGGTGGNVVVARLTGAGVPVPEFGGAGTVTADLGGDETGYGVRFTPLGGAMVVGERVGDSDGAGFIARFLSSGLADPALPPAGVQLTGPVGGPRLRAITPEGFVAGSLGADAYASSAPIALTTWQQQVVDFGRVHETGVRAVRQADGKIVLAGQTGGIVGAVRHYPDGSVDPSYGHGGRTVTDLIADPVSAVLDGGGGVVVAGRYRSLLALVRVGPDGRVDFSFGTGGRLVFENSSAGSAGSVLLPGGKLLVIGSMPNSLTFVTRVSATGVPDPSFGTGGRVDLALDGWLSRVLLQPDGKVVVVAWTRVARLLPSGALDGAFGTAGVVTLPRPAVSGALLADGRIVLGDHGSFVAAVGRLQRLTADGAIDPTYDSSSPVGVKGAVASVIPLADGRVLAVGRDAAYRFLPSGGIDRTFGVRGRLALDDADDLWVVDAFLTGDGALFTAGSLELGDGSVRFSVTRNRAGSGLTVPGASGWNAFGQLGTGSRVDRRSVTAVAGLTGVASLSAGTYHTLAVRSDGTVWAWGWNGLGQLGDGTTTDRPAPVKVAGLTDVVEVSAGAAHSLAVKVDGTVWAWGWNAVGQLGDGTTIDRHQPVKVASAAGFTSVAAGALHSLALSGNWVYAWGWNGVGQLGDGTHMDRLVPQMVPWSDYAPPVRAIAAGAYHSVVVTEAGSVSTWGWNAYGQLGMGTTGDRVLPSTIDVGRDAVVRSVAAGGMHTLAVLSDGTVRAWGWNGNGQLGDGTTVDRLTPVPVPGLTQVRSIAGGMYHSAAVSMDGTVRAWGWNGVGQLGTGGTADSRIPVVVPVPRAGTIAAGGFHTVIS